MRQLAGSPTARRSLAAVLSTLLLVTVAACSSGGSEGGDRALDASSDCLVVETIVSPEKIDLVSDLARSFNRTESAVDGRCVFVNPRAKASGAAMAALASGWNAQVDGSAPVIWSPAASAWGAILDQRLSDRDEGPMAGHGTSFMSTPLVIAMPRPMAEALGWPANRLGWRDLIELSTNGSGWAAHGHPEWGQFRLGKTNPDFSTSGLDALIAQSYAAAGKTSDLTVEDLGTSSVIDTNRKVESAVVHYGDTTLTFLENWYRADLQGTGLQYVSAVAVEEKSVIDYNTGNPDGILQPGEEPRPPRVPLVAIYPEEGTISSDNPFFLLDAPWVSDEQRAGAALFQDYVQRPENQVRALESNFRPGDPQVPLGPPIDAANGADPSEPRTLLQLPDPEVMVELLRHWHDVRKEARVLLVLDVSGSMGERASAGASETKLDLATQAVTDALGRFGPDDQVGLRWFATGLGPSGTANWVDSPPIAPMSRNEEALRQELDRLSPTNGTPLYDVTLDSVRTLYEQFDQNRINAVVLLTDGRNDDASTDSAMAREGDASQLAGLVQALGALTSGAQGRPVRLFTIAYGVDADLAVLRQIAEATNGAAYNASDPSSIRQVFNAVLSNF